MAKIPPLSSCIPNSSFRQSPIRIPHSAIPNPQSNGLAISALQPRSRSQRCVSITAYVVMSINSMTFVAPNLACGEAQWPRAAPRSGAVTDEQRSRRPNSAQPAGRQVFSAQTSLLAPYRSTVGYARRSRLVWAKNPWPRTSSHLCS